MKILITAPSLDETENVSGIASVIRGIIKSSSAHLVHFVAGRKDSEKFDLSWLFRQTALPIKFIRTIRRENPDAIHVNTAFVPLAIVRDAALCRAARFTGKPILLHIHGGEFLMQEFTNAIIASLAQKLLGFANKIIVLSESEKRNLLIMTPGLDITILPNAIDLDDVPVTERGPGEKTIVFFGRLHKSKGLSDVIEVCRTLKNQGFHFTFTCYGSGPEERTFVSEMTAILGEKFIYGGVVTGPDKWKALADADIFLLPSRYEGLPMALLEAMAAGCIPVVSDKGSISTVIEDGHNGFLIEPGNLTQIVGRLKNLLAGETGWDELRRNARATVAKNFNLEDYARKLDGIYEDIAKHSRTNYAGNRIEK